MRIQFAIKLVAGAVVAANAIRCSAQIESKFKPQTWKDGGSEFAYRLYLPEGAEIPESIESWPILVWLHGEGERGTDYRRSLRWLPMVFAKFDNAPPFFILVTQHPSKVAWTSQQKPESDFLATTYQILEKTLADYPIDPDRVYVSGVSSGGTACWELICRHPETFAAAAPLASAGGNVANADRLATLPIWAFHCEVDKSTPPESVRGMVDAVQKAGGIAHLTETPNSANWTHDAWTPAINEHDSIAWMLSQRRGAWFMYWRPGGMSPSQFLQLGCWLVVLAFFGLLWRRERHRQKRIQQEARAVQLTGKTIDELFETNPLGKVPTET